MPMTELNNGCDTEMKSCSIPKEQEGWRIKVWYSTKTHLKELVVSESSQKKLQKTRLTRKKAKEKGKDQADIEIQTAEQDMEVKQKRQKCQKTLS